MSEQVTLIVPETDPRWDRFVESHPLGMVYHLSGWKRVMEASFPHMKGHYLTLLDGTSDNIRAAMPLFEVRSWLTGKRLVSIPFASGCDPLISTSDDFAILFDSSLSLSRKLGISRVEIRTYRALPLVQDGRLGRSGLYKIHYLSLEQGPEQLWKNFHRSCIRQKISRAIKNELTMRTVESKSDLQAFYRLYVMTRQRLCLPPQPYTFFESLWDTFFEKNHITALLAIKDGKPIAGLMLFHFKDRVSAEFGVSDHTYWDFNPNHYLFWEAIQSACRQGFEVFDFGRTSPHNRELMDFKGRWGAVEADLVEFQYPRKVRNEVTVREHSGSYQLMRRLLQYVPESMFERFGGFCYRHLG
ncbi:MAG: GNAT family N-acetyltransferase [bacterium]